MTPTVEFIGREYTANAHGLLVPKGVKRPTVVDLFCGAGGFSLGFLQAGWDVLCGVDNDPTATITYLSNLGSYPINLNFATPADKERLNDSVEREWQRRQKRAKSGTVPVFPVSGSSGYWQSAGSPPVRTFWFGDVRQMNGKDILASMGLQPGELDCVCGGPPCQGFSRAGKRQVADPRNNLVFEYGRLILEMRPRTFVMENVPDILNMVTPEGLPIIDTLCLMLEDGGYGVADRLKQSLIQNPNARAGIRSDQQKSTSQQRTRDLEHKRESKARQGDLFDSEIGTE